MNEGRERVSRILKLAWPVLIGQWAQMAYGVVDTVMTGHSSSADLAAMALGSSIYASVFVGLMGVIIGINPIVAQHFGAKRQHDIGRTFTQGLWLCVWLTVVGVAALSFPHFWLSMSHVDETVATRVAGYLHALAFAMPAALVFRTVYAFNTALSRPKLVMAINLIGLGVKIPLNYVLIFGRFGLPTLGAAGCGVATALVMWTSCLLALLAMRTDRFYVPFGIRAGWPAWAHQKELLKIGVPTGLSYIVEVTSFTFMALLVARLGADVTGGHQITANLAALCYMVPMALSVATSTLIAQALGANAFRLARRMAVTGLWLALGLAATVSSGVWLFRHAIVAGYTSEAGAAATALSLIPVMVIFHLFDATQSVAGFSLRAYKHAMAPMIIYTVCLWGLGLGGGYWVAFHETPFGPPRGAIGLWLAATGSLFVAAVALLIHLNWVSNQQRRGGPSTLPADQLL